MRRIPLLENSDGLFMAGDNLERVWRDIWLWKGNATHDFQSALYRYGSRCPAQGCHHCTNPDCLYADFISRYWSYPHGD